MSEAKQLERSSDHAFFAVADDGTVWECAGGGQADWHFGPADGPIMTDGNRCLRWCATSAWPCEQMRDYAMMCGFSILD